MFLAHCPTCGLRELRGPRSIELLVNGAAGATLVYRCRRCGEAHAVLPTTPVTPVTPMATQQPQLARRTAA
jgi:DNA-directed RNA polymerase subunit RPC12/RpoP